MERKQSVTQNMQYKIARFQSGYEIVSFAAVIGRGVTQLSVLLGGGGGHCVTIKKRLQRRLSMKGLVSKNMNFFIKINELVMVN